MSDSTLPLPGNTPEVVTPPAPDVEVYAVPTSIEEAHDQRDRLEEYLVPLFDAMLDDFLRAVYSDAVDALSSPVIVAAAHRVLDPFAWTTTRSRWYDAIRAMAQQNTTLIGPQIVTVLRESGLPFVAYSDVSEILRQSVEEGWTEYKTKRTLSARLIPKRHAGEKVESYRVRIRTAARTAATSNYNSSAVMSMAERGVTAKKWVARMDSRTRPDHAHVHGTTLPIDQLFTVGAALMSYPGDPAGPLEQTANCRCILVDASLASSPLFLAAPDELGLPASAAPAGDTMGPMNTSRARDTAIRRLTEMTATPAATLAVEAVPDPAPEGEAPLADTPTDIYWEGPIGMEGVLTGDGRFIEPNALRWSDLPNPFRAVMSDVGGHDGAQIAGSILTIERRDGGVIWASGDFDMASEVGREAQRLAHEGRMTGVSMDLDDVTFEVRLAADVVAEVEAQMQSADEAMEDGESPEVFPEKTPSGEAVVYKGSPDDEIQATLDARIRAATLCAIPAFAEARISTTDQAPSALAPVDDTGEVEDVDALVASAIPMEPPARWFSDPGLTAPTALTITDEGRIYGHIAVWGTCHIGYQSQCVQPPHSASGYSLFRTGSIRTADGTDVSVGHITMNTGHANPRAKASGAIAHYDDTGMVVADIATGEDGVGIWCAGALRPGTSTEDIRALRSAPLSGDWRTVRGNLELVAVLAVNTPGFPVPRAQGLVASGEMLTLVAGGLVIPDEATEGQALGLTPADLSYLKRLAARGHAEDERRKQRAISLGERVDRALATDRVRRMAAALR